jgi:hypothetical protein
MFDESPAACVVTDPACIVIDANRAAEVMLLRSGPMMRRKPFSLLVATSDRLNFAAIAVDILSQPFGSGRPLSMKPSRGDDIEVVFNAFMMRGDDGRPEMISWVFLESACGPGSDLI